MIVLSMKDIEKYYGANKVLNNITFEINEGEKAALVGRNGCGKSTVFKIIAGIEKYESGTLALRKNIRVGYLEQVPDSVTGSTVYGVLLEGVGEIVELRTEMAELERLMSKAKDNAELEDMVKKYGKLCGLFEGMGGYSLESRIDIVTAGLQIPKSMYDMRFDQLSGGEKTRVLFARMLISQPELLLLDEPTNHLDTDSIEWLEGFIKEYRGTVLVVSHDRYFIDKTVDRVIEIEDGECQAYEGNYTYFISEKERRLLVEFENYKDQQKKIKRMEEAIKRLRDWGNRGDNEKFFRKAASIQKAIDRMEKLNRPVMEKKSVDLNFEASGRSGRNVISCERITKAYSSKSLLKETDFYVRFGERVGIIGPNGSGKSTLLKIILGRECSDEGSASLGSNVKTGYLEQSIVFEDENRTILEEFKNMLNLTEGEARGRLARFLFYKDSVYKRLSGLSGGEKARLRLAELMYSDINLFILDEPTNHLDIDTRESLEAALESFDGTVVFISHDRYFINKLSDRLYNIEEGRLVEYCGNYDYFKEKLKEGERKVQIKKEKKPPNADKRVRQRVQNEEKIIADIENCIVKLEEEIAFLKRSMEEPENASNFIFLQETGLLLEEKEAALEVQYSRWQDVEEAAKSEGKD